VQIGIEKEASLSDFFNEGKLGEGTFGTVYKGKNKHNGKYYAIKEIPKIDNSPKEVEIMNKEIKIMYMCNHPNLLKLFSHFESDASIYLVMELTTGGDLM